MTDSLYKCVHMLSLSTIIIDVSYSVTDMYKSNQYLVVLTSDSTANMCTVQIYII